MVDALLNKFIMEKTNFSLNLAPFKVFRVAVFRDPVRACTTRLL